MPIKLNLASATPVIAANAPLGKFIAQGEKGYAKKLAAAEKEVAALKAANPVKDLKSATDALDKQFTKLGLAAASPVLCKKHSSHFGWMVSGLDSDAWSTTRDASVKALKSAGFAYKGGMYRNGKLGLVAELMEREKAFGVFIEGDVTRYL